MPNQIDDHFPDRMRFQALLRERLYEGLLALSDAGLYVFVRVTPPRFIYVGRSLSLPDRVTAEPRVRQPFTHVLVFDFPGVAMSLATSRELERRVLRLAWDRWPWARWTNRTDIHVMLDRHLVWPGSPPMMEAVERVLTEVEQFMASQSMFDPRCPTYLDMNRILGRPSDEVHAFGAAAAAGFTVLAGSRLSLGLKSAAELQAAPSPEARFAQRLWERGILHRKSNTRTREDGIYFLHDQGFADPLEAASVLFGRRVEVDLWREPTEEERLRFSVPPGTHRRWR